MVDINSRFKNIIFSLTGVFPDEEVNDSMSLIRKYNIDDLKQVLDDGADCNMIVACVDNLSAVNYCTKHGALEVVKVLLEYGADPELKLGKNTPMRQEQARKTRQSSLRQYIKRQNSLR